MVSLLTQFWTVCFRAAEQLTNAKVPHVLAAVDATQERELANRYQYHLF